MLILLAAGVTAVQVSEQQQVTPIQKVIQMLNDMLSKGKQEMEDEQTRFAAFKQFCDSTSAEKSKAIAKGTDKVAKLTADIGEADADAAQMAKDIGGLDNDISTWDAEHQEQSAQRAKDHDEFVKTHQELTESVDAVERAVETISAGPGASLAQTSLLELSSKSLVPASAKRIIASFLQKTDPETALMQDAMEVSAPEAHVFESQSGGVLDMVKGLGEKFEEQRDTLEKEEMNDKHTFDMMAQDLTDQIESATKNREKKSSFKSQRESDKADFSGELADTQATLAEDKKFLADMTAECEQKATDFEGRQEVRQGEIEAINKAIEIMSSDEVSGAGAKHLPGLVQTSAKVSLAQLRSENRSPALGIAADFLRDRAARTSSRMLSLLAAKVEADPFKKVTKMIKDMIQKLMQEATEEAEHKGFCDTELGTNKITRDSKTDEVASLTAESDELTASINKLANDIAALGASIAALDASVAKATALRAAEKEKNTATLEDATVAQAAVQKALAVLKEFYDKAADGSMSLAQQKSTVPGGPEMEEGTYTGMGNGGVMGMLEVIESDFARLISETTASENESAKEFEQFSSDSAMDKALKSTDMKDKESTKTKKESDLASAQKDLKGSKEELDAAMEYYEKLKPSCVDAGISYEERVQRRKEEIESLQEALKILSGSD